MKVLSYAALLSISILSMSAQAFYLSPATGEQGLVSFNVRGSCEMTIQPDLAVIAGGITGSGLKPTDAVHQLVKQLAAVADYVQSQHGHLSLLERVRLLKNPDGGNGANEDDQPAEVMQHFHVELPPD